MIVSEIFESQPPRSVGLALDGLIHLPPASEPVIDADEEIFLIYTSLAGDRRNSPEHTGLGSVDSRSSEITISFSIEPPLVEASNAVKASPSGRTKSKGRHPSSKKEAVDVELTLEQDPSSLRSRKGDTGSVLWRASVHLARLILQQHHFPPSPPSQPLLDASLLPSTRILELGAGIGLLGCILAPLVSHYTITDLDVLIPLIQKNLKRTVPPSHSSKVSAVSLDWSLLHETRESRRAAAFDIDEEGPFDLIICCDCIYNTGLVPPLITTINYCARTTDTAVLVVVELREEDVLREFLTQWLTSGPWQIFRLPQECLGVRTVGWIGKKQSPA